MAKEAVPVACPIGTTLGTLGGKWTLLILRDMVFMGETRFSGFLRTNPGLTTRVLSRKLKELVDWEYAQRHDDEDGVHYRLTHKGRDTEPILRALAGFGFRYHGRELYSDGKQRDMRDVLGPPDPYARRPLARDARVRPRPS